MKTHRFDTTDKAYATTQSDGRVKKGDLLVIDSERVVGIADTRPFAVSLVSGKLDPLPRGVHLWLQASAPPVDASPADAESAGWWSRRAAA